MRRYEYTEMTVKRGRKQKSKKIRIRIRITCIGESFQLTVKPGEFTDSEIVVMLGENGKMQTKKDFSSPRINFS